MKYFIVLSIASLFFLTSCFEKQTETGDLETQETISDENAPVQETITPEEESPEDNTMEQSGEESVENVSTNETENTSDSTGETSPEAEVSTSEEDVTAIEQDLEMLFKDILGE